MSPKRDKTVPELVEKYRRAFPSLESCYVRRLIRAEHPELFKNTPSMAANLKKLTRYLKKSFETNKPTLGAKASKLAVEGLTQEASKRKHAPGFWNYLKWRSTDKKLEDEREKDRRIRILDAKCNALMERMTLPEIYDGAEHLKRKLEIEEKYLARAMKQHKLAYPEDKKSE